MRRGVKGLYRTGITRMAAALAYRTIFSMIPMLAIGLLIFGSVVSERQVESGVRRVLEFAGVSQITVNAPAERAEQVLDGQGEGVGGGDEAAVVEERSEMLDSAGEIEEIISDLVVRVNNALQDLPTGWIALVTGLVLLYAALSMIIEVEKSFNQLCGAPDGRSWARRLVLYWTMLSLGGVMLAATFWTGDALASFLRGSGGSMIRSSLAGYGVSVLISTVLLTAAYKFIPNVRLKFRPILAGAFIAAVCWELGKLGFTGYLRYSTGYAQFYGSLALLPLFMLWVYVTWVIVLLGLQAAYTLQHFSRLMAFSPEVESGPRLVDPTVSVAIVGEIVRAHRSGGTPDENDIGDAIGIEGAVVEPIVRRLERAQIIRRVVSSSGDDGWVPARPVELIGVEEVLDAVSDLEATRASEDAVGALLTMLHRARHNAAKGQTIGSALKKEPNDD